MAKPKKKSKKEEKEPIKLDYTNVNAVYYHDGSGEITLSCDGEEFLHREDAKLPHHIEYIQEHMANLKKQIEVCKDALFALNQVKL